MPQLSEDEKNRLFMTLDFHTKQNETIERGLYGDKANKVPGALDQIEELRLEIKKIQAWINKHNLKTAYVSGVVASVVLLFKAGWDWIIYKSDGK